LFPGRGGHQHEYASIAGPNVLEPVLISSGREHCRPRAVYGSLPADVEAAGSFENEVDFVGVAVNMRGLGLTHSKAINVQEETLGLKDAVLLELVGRKPAEGRQVPHIHKRRLRRSFAAERNAYLI
jgi:hypothetical protein